MNFHTLGAAAVAAVAATGAHAASITFDFTNPAPFGTVATDLTFTEDGLSVDVSPLVYDGGGIKTDPGARVGWWRSGLGVRDTGDTDHKVDGLGDPILFFRNGDNNALVFDFGDRDVRLESISFSYADSNDEFSVFTSGDGTSFQFAERTPTGAGIGGNVSTSISTAAFTTLVEGSIFAIAARDNNDEFKVSALTVSEVAPVPLPATGLLLLAGLAGLGAARRRAG